MGGFTKLDPSGNQRNIATLQKVRVPVPNGWLLKHCPGLTCSRKPPWASARIHARLAAVLVAFPVPRCHGPQSSLLHRKDTHTPGADPAEGMRRCVSGMRRTSDWKACSHWGKASSSLHFSWDRRQETTDCPVVWWLAAGRLSDAVSLCGLHRTHSPTTSRGCPRKRAVLA